MGANATARLWATSPCWCISSTTRSAGQRNVFFLISIHTSCRIPKSIAASWPPQPPCGCLWTPLQRISRTKRMIPTSGNLNTRNWYRYSPVTIRQKSCTSSFTRWPMSKYLSETLCWHTTAKPTILKNLPDCADTVYIPSAGFSKRNSTFRCTSGLSRNGRKTSAIGCHSPLSLWRTLSTNSTFRQRNASAVFANSISVIRSAIWEKRCRLLRSKPTDAYFLWLGDKMVVTRTEIRIVIRWHTSISIIQ